jgi:hypothetical protein
MAHKLARSAHRLTLANTLLAGVALAVAIIALLTGD